MAGASITIKGLDKTKARVKRIVPEIEKELRSTMIEEARDLVADAREAIESPKSGRMYMARFRGSGQPYRWRASAPGESPAKRTGENMERIKAKRWNLKERAGAKLSYPNIYRMLERGMGGARPVKPRPLFSKVMQGRAEKVRDAVEATTTRVLAVKIRRK